MVIKSLSKDFFKKIFQKNYKQKTIFLKLRSKKKSKQKDNFFGIHHIQEDSMVLFYPF